MNRRMMPKCWLLARIEFFFLIMLKISNTFVKIDLTKQLTNYSQNRCQRIRMTDMDK